ncbi:hypothetical protein J6590_079251 [Homalodisca vitripennis]|nr:hypothetical protein J6590_079251 [Homalodisca vitripennis]
MGEEPNDEEGLREGSGTAGDAGTISHDTEVSADAEEKEGETQWPTKRLEINNYLQRREQNQRWREGSRF